jgi:hypothetical protein
MFIAAMTYLAKFRKVVFYLAGIAFGLSALFVGAVVIDAHHYFEAGKPAAQSANVYDQFNVAPAAPVGSVKIDARQQPVIVPVRAPAAAAPAPAGGSLEQRIDDALKLARTNQPTVVPSEHYRDDGTRDSRFVITPQVSPPGSGGLVLNPGTAPAAAASGWYVSLKSSPDERALQGDIPGMADKYKSALDGVQLSSKIVDLGATFTYRLVAGPLGTQAEAAELCQKIKGVGGDRACFVTKWAAAPATVSDQRLDLEIRQARLRAALELYGSRGIDRQ